MQLAKSLHTITVLENLAKHLMDKNITMSAAAAVGEALFVLGLDDKEDVYGLGAKAVAKIEAASTKKAPRGWTLIEGGAEAAYYG